MTRRTKFEDYFDHCMSAPGYMGSAILTSAAFCIGVLISLARKRRRN